MSNPNNGHNYHSAGPPPDFMEFGGPPGRRAHTGVFRRGFVNRARPDWQQGRGGFRPPRQPWQQHRQQAPYQGFRGGGPPHRGFRGRGGNNQHGGGGGAVQDIAAFFHPSMLEDPWAGINGRGCHPAPAVAVPLIQVEPDDPELQAIVKEMNNHKSDTEQTASHVQETSSAPAGETSMETGSAETAARGSKMDQSGSLMSDSWEPEKENETLEN
ncbi:hypothetical protein BV898_06832 [Hypsibius exemplaris]|uniref:Uncharacterized protein n=1 Tax=Hypsibius exemplaris TaxID=2072580 RepID=A0A1W0WVG7_HYPEX|nr:hypothetical protein BV898_06832 [Hypsibius exemplaris]